MTTGVSELVAGTKNAEEVFSDFMKNVGNVLLETAQQMIATYIAIGIARAFAGLGGPVVDQIPTVQTFAVLEGGGFRRLKLQTRQSHPV